MKSAYGWFGIYLSLGTVLLCAYLVWRAVRDARRQAGSSTARDRGTAAKPWKQEDDGGWTPDLEPWSPADTGGWEEELDGSWSPDDDAGGGVLPKG